MAIFAIILVRNPLHGGWMKVSVYFPSTADTTEIAVIRDGLLIC